MPTTVKLVNVEGSETSLTQRSYSGEWVMETDFTMGIMRARVYSRYYGPNQVPEIGRPYMSRTEADYACRFRGASYSRHPKRHNRWIITGEWRTNDGERSDDIELSNPLLKPTQHWIESSTSTEPLTLATFEGPGEGMANAGVLRGQKGPICNSVGRQLTDPVMVEKFGAVLCARKRFTSLAAAYSINRQYFGTINADPFYHFGRDHAAFMRADSSEQMEQNGQLFFEVTTRVKVQADRPIYHRTVNEGYHHYHSDDFDGDTGNLKSGAELVRASDSGDPTAEPVLLGLDGRRLPAGRMGIALNWRADRRSYRGLVW